MRDEQVSRQNERDRAPRQQQQEAESRFNQMNMYQPRMMSQQMPSYDSYHSSQSSGRSSASNSRPSTAEQAAAAFGLRSSGQNYVSSGRANGREIFVGPRGGRYTMTPHGPRVAVRNDG